jgi:predicted NBD/HSP70 family sugar kinase
MASTRTEVYRLIRDEGPISRSGIQSKLDISAASVSTVVSGLLEQELVVRGRIVGNGVGRKTELLEHNPRKGYVLGVDLGAKAIRVAVADLCGAIVHKTETSTLAYEGGARVMQRLMEACRSAVASADIHKSKILAIGVAAPGISLGKTGRSILAPFIPDWSDVPFRSLLQSEFGCEVLVENDVDMAIIGERRWGVGKGCDNLVFINMAVGVAAGIIVDGNLIKGCRNAAGEIGYMVADPSMIRPAFSVQGALERSISGPGIARRWRDLVGDADRAGDEPAQIVDSEMVLALAAQGDVNARKVIDDTLQYLCSALSNIAAVVNPEKVILGGGVGLALCSYARSIAEFLKHHLPFPPEIVQAELGSDASLFGSIAVAIDSAFDALERGIG